jgi:peptidoglycan/xylan/chitin deacetylase (PgdA/CDA1 family)
MSSFGNRPIAVLTIDLEDYRRQYLRDYWRSDTPPYPREVQRQAENTLELLDACHTRATFFTVGRLASELPRSTWSEITSRHRVGCHGNEHLPVDELGPERFRDDLLAAKSALEDVAGQPVTSYRAPYFRAERCDPWFAEGLARAGVILDNSVRLNKMPHGFVGTYPVAGVGGAVREVPIHSIGWGVKRLTVIGGTYFRLLPLRWILHLLARSARLGFVPLVYIHPYDLDSSAEPIAYPARRFKSIAPCAADWIRRTGRSTAAEKLRALARIYDFHPIEELDTSARAGIGGLVPSSTR